MDKKVIFAVAGAGKTTYIINDLSLEKRALIITYTRNNFENIRVAIIRKWGYFPSNIRLLTYFGFLYAYCFKPFLGRKFKVIGINWDPNRILFAKGIRRYIDRYQRLFSNRIAKFIELNEIHDDIDNRLKKYNDKIYIDEVQDLAGHDFNFLKSLAGVSIDYLLVGDFYQHTFDTSRDGSVNKTLHDEYEGYIRQFEDIGFTIDTQSLMKSYRCSPSVCAFITENLGIAITSHRSDITDVVFIDNEHEANEIFYNNKIVKLFYKEHYKYQCQSKNWGESKGEDRYDDVCVVVNKNVMENFRKGKAQKLAPSTRNKLYVACSRAKATLYFVEDRFYKRFRLQKENLE